VKIVIDMNLSPKWVSILKSAGHEAIHWSQVGAPNAPDREIMGWARTNNHVVFTHDLDFGAILAATDANSPSVFQIRSQDVSPKRLSALQMGGTLKKLNFFVDEDVHKELNKLVPAGQKIRIINEALRKELLMIKREKVTEKLMALKSEGEKVPVGEIVEALKSDRGRHA
jgi:predicted nuclease of predicted toxin-antitoxin system